VATRAGALGCRTVAMALAAGERWSGECRDCGHAARLDLAALARRTGPNLYLSDALRAVRCPRCRSSYVRFWPVEKGGAGLPNDPPLRE
jgi:hypothetical protein